MNISIILNGTPRNITVEADESLLHTLRRVGCLSVKCGCETGGCGTCCVVMDNELVNTCLINSASLNNNRIITTEGLGTPDDPHPIQLAFVRAGAVQCGFCTPGFVMATYALLLRHPDPDDDQIRNALSGNICRCTGHTKIFDAVRMAAAMMKKDSSASGQGRGGF